MMIITLVAATIVTTNRMLEGRGGQRDEASFQARRAQASSEFMRNLVTQIGATPMTMKQVLDRGRDALSSSTDTIPRSSRACCSCCPVRTWSSASTKPHRR